MKNTDCLCRKVLREIAPQLPRILLGWALVAVWFYFSHADRVVVRLK